jgi:hypothetical protein
MVVGRLLSHSAPDSPVRHRTLSGAPATSASRWGSTVGALTCGTLGLSGGAPDRSCKLSGAPPAHALALARTVAHWMRLQSTVAREVVVAPLAHRTVRWIIAERPLIFPKVASWASSALVHRTLSGGAPDTVRWHTGQSGAPDQGAFGLFFALFVWTLSRSFYWLCCEPLAPVELID